MLDIDQKIEAIERAGELISEVENLLLALGMPAEQRELSAYRQRVIENHHRHLVSLWALQVVKPVVVEKVKSVGIFKGGVS